MTATENGPSSEYAELTPLFAQLADPATGPAERTRAP